MSNYRRKNEFKLTKFLDFEEQKELRKTTSKDSYLYFEGGYAMGNNIPVIWCCRKDEIEKVHFDTNHYNPSTMF